MTEPKDPRPGALRQAWPGDEPGEPKQDIHITVIGKDFDYEEVSDRLISTINAALKDKPAPTPDSPAAEPTEEEKP